MRSKEKHSKLFFPIARRCISSNQQTTTAPSSFLVRFIKNRRENSQQDDIRLEPYISKGVYLESGGIRPVSFILNNVFPLFIFLCVFRCLNDIHLVL